MLAETARGGEEPSEIDLRPLPTVVLIVGVNGTGKTTTLGKLAWQLRERFGLRVLLAAADTYRAAATEQLEGWARRAGCEIVTGEPRADPGSVAFEALAQARAGGFDVVLIDTAGRLHNQEPLMGELEKVRRVIARQLEGAPHETLLTIDATTGQNGLRQAELFARAAAVDGIVLTKLDGSAKGGSRDRDRARARNPGQADRRRRAAGRSAAVRSGRLCPGADRPGLDASFTPRVTTRFNR